MAGVFAWEAAEHQHTLAALWGAAYLLRAELLTVARLVSMDASEPELNGATAATLWRYAQVQAAVARYRAAYGDALLHVGPGLGPQEIAGSAGWTPPLTPAQDLLLASLGSPDCGRAEFTARLDAAAGGTTIVERGGSVDGLHDLCGGAPSLGGALLEQAEAVGGAVGDVLQRGFLHGGGDADDGCFLRESEAD